MSPVKREYTTSDADSDVGSKLSEYKQEQEHENESDNDHKPNPKKAKTQKQAPKLTTPKKTPAPSPSKKKSPVKPEPTSPTGHGTGAEGGKKMGAWSGEELKLLYGLMCPKRVGVNWSDVSSQIPGRDPKACNNKWFRMQGKIMKAIEELGE